MKSFRFNKLLAITLAVLVIGIMALSGCAGNNDTTSEQTSSSSTPESTSSSPSVDKPSDSGTTTITNVEITEAGSTTVQPLAEELAEAFMAMNPGATITIQGGGSSVGVKSASEGTVDIGAASRELKDSEKSLGLVVHTLAQDGIAIVANSAQSVDNLTAEQVMQIFSGEITNWSEVGGDDEDITVVSREEGSGTRGAFEELVMGEELITARAILQPSNGALRTAVAGDPNAIGFMSFGYLDGSVKALDIDSVAGTVDNVLNGSYPIVRPLIFVTKGEPTGAIKSFIDYCLSKDGQAIVAEDYISVLAGSSNEPVTGEITEAGSTTVQPLAEELAEAFMAMNPDLTITIQGGGSSVGVKSASEGTVDIGAASRELKDSEKSLGLVVHTLAQDGIAIVANSAQSVDNLTAEQVMQIFSGEITNWSEIGGDDEDITVVSREEGSGTRGAFEELVMGEELITARAILQPSNGALRTAVAGDPNAIGFMSFGYLDGSVKALDIDGVAGTVANVLNGSYPLVRPLIFVTKGEPTGAVKSFIDYCLDEGQEIVAEDYISIK